MGSQYLIISELELFTLLDAILPWEGQMISVELLGPYLNVGWAQVAKGTKGERE